MHCCIIFCNMTYFGGSPSGEAAKIGVIYIEKIICSLVNRGIYGDVAGLRNIFQCICRLDITEEYTFILHGTDKYRGIYSSALYSSVSSLVNRGIYGDVAGLRNIFQCICRLDITEEYTFILHGTDEYRGIYSSALYSSVSSLVNQGI
jgi:uncharacterized protein YwgA